MSASALDLIGRYLAAMQRNDWQAGHAFFASDIVLHVPGRSAAAGVYRGKDAVVGYLDAAVARSHGDVEIELVDTLASEERVALIVRERFVREDGAVEIRRANVYRVRGGQIAEVWIFEANQYEVDELFAD